MRDYGIDKGLIQQRDDSLRSQKGFGKGFWGFRKMFRDYLTKLNVAFYDACCPELTGNVFPVRFNLAASEGEELEYFNGTLWTTIPISSEFDFNAALNAEVSANGINGQSGYSGMLLPVALLPEHVTGDTPAISLEAFETLWTTTGTDTMAIPNGTQVGQIKMVYLEAHGGDGTVTPDNTGVLWTSATLQGAGAWIKLWWGGGGWLIYEHSTLVTVNP
jgi:hypothetical protein